MTDRHIEMQVETNIKGSLLISENFPFDVKRTFVMYMNIGKQWGSHANHECDQIFTVISGEAVLRIETSKDREKYHMRQSGHAIYVPASAWRTITAVTQFACVLVHASTIYDEADYIRDYDEFKATLQQS